MVIVHRVVVSTLGLFVCSPSGCSAAVCSIRLSTLTDNQHWQRSRSPWMDPSENASRLEQPPAWNGKADTWDDWEREALWTDSFDTKTGANTWTTSGQNSQSSSTSVRRRPLSSKGGAREEHWCGGSVHSVATLREMLGPSTKRKAGSESFAACDLIQQGVTGSWVRHWSAWTPHWMLASSAVP